MKLLFASAALALAAVPAIAQDQTTGVSNPPPAVITASPDETVAPVQRVKPSPDVGVRTRLSGCAVNATASFSDIAEHIRSVRSISPGGLPYGCTDAARPGRRDRHLRISGRCLAAARVPFFGISSRIG